MSQNVEKPSNNMDKITEEKYNKSRERSDRISALMGQYMLKGYRMLGSTCEVCGVSIIVKVAYWTFLALSENSLQFIYSYLWCS